MTADPRGLIQERQWTPSVTATYAWRLAGQLADVLERTLNELAAALDERDWARWELKALDAMRVRDNGELIAARDAAVAREAKLREALEPFARFGVAETDEYGWTSREHRQSISTWFGPSEFRAAALVSPEASGEQKQPPPAAPLSSALHQPPFSARRARNRGEAVRLPRCRVCLRRYGHCVCVPDDASSASGVGQSPPSERAQLEWWLDRLEDPAFHLGAADRGMVAHLVRNVLAGAGQVPADTIEKAREAIWGALTILRLLRAQQERRGHGGYAHVTSADIARLEAAYAALAAVRTPEEKATPGGREAER